jgi:uncharacterized protein YutE (UPF0331/DUF86 family)
MSPSGIKEKIVAEKMAWIISMIENIHALPLDTIDVFTNDIRNTAAAESYLRRALEGIMDLGRHILAKGFGEAVIEYKTIAFFMKKKGILDEAHAELLKKLAGYRNRMVHFYVEISDQELYEICTEHISDLYTILNTISEWLKKHPELIDRSL